MNYAALGHIHVPGAFKAGEVTAVYPFALSLWIFGDKGERGVYLVTAARRRDKPGSASLRVHSNGPPRDEERDLDITALTP